MKTRAHHRPTRALGLAFAVSLVAASSAFAGGGSQPTEVTFAKFSQIGTKSDITWTNDIVPAVYKTIPAVTQFIPAVTQVIPAVTKIVKGKVVVVTPAKTIIITPAKTIIITPAKKVLVTPAHDGTSGSLFSTTATNAKTFGQAKVYFSFNITPLADLGNLSALFSFQATSPAVDPALLISNVLYQPDLTGDFSFTYSGVKPLKVWATTYLPGANLLSGHLGSFLLDGAVNGKSGAILATSTTGIVDYSSDFLDFSASNLRELSFYLIASKFQADPGAALHGFTGNTGGSFASAPKPRITAVPEPSTWALMIGGFGLMGLALRNRRRAPLLG